MNKHKISKDILIAGSSGIIGSFLIKNKNCKNIFFSISKSEKSNKNHFQLDLTEKSSVMDFCNHCKQFSTIIFLVGLAHNKGNSRELDLFEKVNYESLVNLLNCLKEVDKLPEKIIFASTISVYGERINKKFYHENLELKPLSPYAITKRKSESFLLKNYKTNTWILRFAPIYSNNFLLNIKRRTKLFSFYYKISDGKQKLSLCNIFNAKIVIDNIVNEKIPSGVYNVSDNKEYSYKNLLKLKNSRFVIFLPKIVIHIIYKVGLIFNNIFLIENSIKLMKDNIYPSKKIRNFVNLPWELSSLKSSND